ncbi:lipoprotein [Actibacterium sp. XHP0104]|nr:lipoprotein [Actibacterium sp. XHP0104]MCV2882879.1 lipoprotein [Actibacterium sp. XHP0104]
MKLAAALMALLALAACGVDGPPERPVARAQLSEG